jgi:hypothetical protein
MAVNERNAYNYVLRERVVAVVELEIKLFETVRLPDTLPSNKASHLRAYCAHLTVRTCRCHCRT